MIACDCTTGCVVCEVDGLPMDPVRFAERQAMDREGHEALARFLAAPARPMAVSGVVHHRTWSHVGPV